MKDQLAYADRLVRRLSEMACATPVSCFEGDKPIECGEVFVCGGMCTPCAARRYVDRYPERVTA